MALVDQQTQFITQFSDVLTGQITGFIVASFRVWEWQFGTANTPMEIAAVALTVADRDAVIVVSSSLCLVLGDVPQSLYTVDTSNTALPVVLDDIDLSM